MNEAVNWARGDEGPWHRITGFPEVTGSANTVCGRVLTDLRTTSPDPPLDSGERCHACRVEGEAHPPDH